jgi:DeoR/GlpR family transcriptional regulator of sugar metabolism
MNSRQEKILEVIVKCRRAEVSNLAKMLNVSPVTIRKDLDGLKEMGLIHRKHGFASIEAGEGDESSLSYHYNLKRRIAQAAASNVADNETVMISNGSCCVILAEELIHSKRNITILTNSIFLANHIGRSPYGKIIVLGGYYQRNAQVLVGSLTHKEVEMFAPNKFFISADGFSENFGFTGHDYLQAQTIQELAKQAKQVSMLFDSEKFSVTDAVKLIPANEIDVLYTDDQIPLEKENYFINNNVSIYKVAARFSR